MLKQYKSLLSLVWQLWQSRLLITHLFIFYHSYQS